MGIEYAIACKQCKVVRDLDKFHNCGFNVKTRADAIAHAEEVSKNSFRAALLSSFMTQHIGHECVFFNEHSECFEEFEPLFCDNEYKGDVNFFVNPDKNED